MVAKAGLCKYPRAYKPPPENSRRPRKPTPAPPAVHTNGKQYYFIEMRYRTPKGRQWKKYMKFMWLDDATINEVVKAPMLQVVHILRMPAAAAVDYFKLIRYKGEEIWL